jgi:hypothetical protein
MLSPKATNRVTLRCGGPTTVTENEHELVRLTWSVAVHVTADTPSGKTDPLAGAQATVVGGNPASTAAGGYVTGTDCALGDDRVTGAGHTALGG